MRAEPPLETVEHFSCASQFTVPQHQTDNLVKLLQGHPLMATPVSTATSLLFTDAHYARSSQWPHFPRTPSMGIGRKVESLACGPRGKLCGTWQRLHPQDGGGTVTGASTEASPQHHRSIKGDISVRFHRFILLLMFVQGYKKKKKKNLQTKHDNISCSYRTMLFVQASSNSMYCIYSIHSNVAITL